MGDTQRQIVQWFPGHMAKTRRLIKESLSLVDGVTEIIDARIPYSSSNPELEEMINGKPRIILLNKCDLADKNTTNQWVEYYKKKGVILDNYYQGGYTSDSYRLLKNGKLYDKLQKSGRYNYTISWVNRRRYKNF